jgi:hypothetical protein
MLTDSLYTMEDVGKHLRVAPEVVKQEIDAGRLRAIVIGGQHVRIREGDLNRYLDDSYAESSAPPTGCAPPSSCIPIDVHPAPDFRHIWPDGKDEQYTNVLEGIAAYGGKEHHVKLGFTTRFTSRKDRSRSLVLVDRYPTVEFVGDSVFERPSPQVLMASLIRDRNGKQIPQGASIPSEYAELGLVAGPYRGIVDGPEPANGMAVICPYQSVVMGAGAANGMAVICESTDFLDMVKHALIRTLFREDRKKK